MSDHLVICADIHPLPQMVLTALWLARLFRDGQRVYEGSGSLRLIVPFSTWSDLLTLAFEEICAYGADSMQVVRRMNAVIDDLILAVPEKRRPALAAWRKRLESTVARSFVDDEQRAEAVKSDRQGLGGARRTDA